MSFKSTHFFQSLTLGAEGGGFLRGTCSLLYVNWPNIGKHKRLISNALHLLVLNQPLHFSSGALTINAHVESHGFIIRYV